MYQYEKMLFMWLLLNILKPNFPTCDWFWADGSQICRAIFLFNACQKLQQTLCRRSGRAASELVCWL